MLIDWIMPNRDGLTLVWQILETDKTLPLIMCTSELDESRVMEAGQAGVNNCLAKAFTPGTLKEMVEATMSKVGAGAS